VCAFEIRATAYIVLPSKPEGAPRRLGVFLEYNVILLGGLVRYLRFCEELEEAIIMIIASGDTAASALLFAS